MALATDACDALTQESIQQVLRIVAETGWKMRWFDCKAIANLTAVCAIPSFGRLLTAFLNDRTFK